MSGKSRKQIAAGRSEWEKYDQEGWVRRRVVEGGGERGTVEKQKKTLMAAEQGAVKRWESPEGADLGATTPLIN